VCQAGGERHERGFLETPQLRLLVLAHARGLIKPDYPHGIKSVIREELLLRQISRDIFGESYYHRAAVEANTLAVVDARSRDEIYKRARSFIMEGAAMKSFYSQTMLDQLQHKDQIEVAQGVSILKILEKSNLFDIMSAEGKLENLNTT
jgi:hypothetical protein